MALTKNMHFEKQFSETKPSNTNVQRNKFLCYHGANFFRLRVILSTLFQRKILITDIRSSGTAPGLQDYEARLLRLIDKIVNGAHFHIDVTGTELRYTSGLLVGGSDIVFDCGLQRNITYFLEALILLAPFAKQPLSITLKGLTHGSNIKTTTEPSIDHFQTVVLPFLQKMNLFDNEDKPSLKLIKRGIPPLGGGEVEFYCPILRHIAPFQLEHDGRIKRIRGTAYTNHVTSQFSQRMIDHARRVLNDYLPDVWIYSSSAKKKIDGPSKGYGLTLVAESMKGFLKAADTCVDMNIQTKLRYDSLNNQLIDSSVDNFQRSVDITTLLKKEDNNIISEEEPSSSLLTESELVGQQTAERLLLEIFNGGIIDSTYQHLPLIFMAMGEDTETSKVKLGPLTQYSAQVLRHLYDFCNVRFTIEEIHEDTMIKKHHSNNDDDDDDNNDTMDDNNIIKKENENISLCIPNPILVKCVGIGFKNVAKRTF